TKPPRIRVISCSHAASPKASGLPPSRCSRIWEWKKALCRNTNRHRITTGPISTTKKSLLKIFEIFDNRERPRPLKTRWIDPITEIVIHSSFCYHGDMNVSLTPELEKIVDQKVKSGLYNSASEVVREGLRLLQQRDEVREAKLNSLRAEIQKGI